MKSLRRFLNPPVRRHLRVEAGPRSVVDRVIDALPPWAWLIIIVVLINLGNWIAR